MLRLRCGSDPTIACLARLGMDQVNGSSVVPSTLLPGRSLACVGFFSYRRTLAIAAAASASASTAGTTWRAHPIDVLNVDGSVNDMLRRVLLILSVVGLV